MKKVAEVKCNTCTNAIIIENGVDLANRHKIILCEAIGENGPVRAPREVVSCTKYRNEYTATGRGLGEFVASATLLQKDGNGNVFQLKRVQPKEDIYWAGYAWRAADAKEEESEEVEDKAAEAAL